MSMLYAVIQKLDFLHTIEVRNTDIAENGEERIGKHRRLFAKFLLANGSDFEVAENYLITV
jgi:hypothetical protein